MANAPVALVTGGSQRIGRAIVEDLAAHGWAVAIHYNHSEKDAEAFTKLIRRSGGQAIAVAGDFADLGAVAGVIEETAAHLGKPVLLVNNASIFEPDQAGALDPALWQRQMTVNLSAPVFLAEAFAAELPDGVEGNIVNLIDQRVWNPTPQFFSYQVSKSALWTATQMHAQAFAPRIRVNAIGPGPTLPGPRQSEEGFRRQAEKVILGHGADLAEFGRTVRFLVENRSITGQMIALDGGQHLAWQTPDIVNVEE